MQGWPGAKWRVGVASAILAAGDRSIPSESGDEKRHRTTASERLIYFTFSKKSFRSDNYCRGAPCRKVGVAEKAAIQTNERKQIMKNHIIDATIAPESLTEMTAAVTTLNTEVGTFGIHLDETQRKHSMKLGTRNETFAREMLEFARQRPDLMPAGIDITAIQRDLAAMDQVTPLLFQLEALTRTLKDTHLALGIDLFNGTRGLYKAVKPIAEVNGVQDVIERIGQRFARRKRTSAEPASGSTEASGQ